MRSIPLEALDFGILCLRGVFTALLVICVILVWRAGRLRIYDAAMRDPSLSDGYAATAAGRGVAAADSVNGGVGVDGYTNANSNAGTVGVVQPSQTMPPQYRQPQTQQPQQPRPSR